MIKNELNKKNYNVIIPKMPNADKPTINSWINKISDIVNIIKNDDIFIGHSIGCQAILRYLENLDNNKKIKMLILIAPWMKLDENTIKEEGKNIIKIAKPWVETPIDFNKIKTHCNNIISIFSNNDPYVPTSNTEIFKKELNSKILMLKNKGHFDASSNVNKLPELLDYIK